MNKAEHSHIKPYSDHSRLCVHTITTKAWSIEEIIDKYPTVGIKGVSVWRDTLEGRDHAKIGERLAAANLSPVALVRGGFFTGKSADARQESIEDNKRAIEEAAAIGAPMVVLVCGATPGQSIAESLNQIRNGLEMLLPFAESHQVELAIEPLHPMYADCRSAICTMATANDLAESFSSDYVGIAADVFHLWWDPNLESEIKRAGKNGNLSAFHICDWKMNMADMLNDRGLMGEGVINIRQIRQWVEEAGFKGFNEVEIFSTHWWNQDPDHYIKKIKDAYLKYA